MESQLRENEAESSRILQSIGDAVIVTDPEARVLRNESGRTRTDRMDSAGALQKPLEQVFPIFSERTGDPVESPVDKVKRFGTIVGLANHTILKHRLGHTTHIDDSSAPIRDEKGKLVGIVLVFRNVDARKEAEASLRDSDDRLRLAQLGAWELDLAGEHLNASPLCKANFGRGPEDPFSYIDFVESIHPEDRPQVEDAVRSAIEARQLYRAEYRVLWPEGSHIGSWPAANSCVTKPALPFASLE